MELMGGVVVEEKRQPWCYRPDRVPVPGRQTCHQPKTEKIRTDGSRFLSELNQYLEETLAPQENKEKLTRKDYEPNNYKKSILLIKEFNLLS